MSGGRGKRIMRKEEQGRIGREVEAGKEEEEVADKGGGRGGEGSG